MQDPSTPNPSDPEKSDSGKPPAKPSQKKPLKLKPLGNPEDPPPAESPSAPEAKVVPEPQPIPETPLKPEPPVNPRPPAEAKAESELDKKRSALKLRRMVIKDVEINPHKNPEAQPTPEAQPFQEPVEAPPPADLKSVMEAPPTQQSATPPPIPEPASPEPESAKAPAPEVKPQPVPEKKPSALKPVPAAAPKPEKAGQGKLSPARKLMAGLAFLAVLALAGMLGIAYFKPFGKNLAPIDQSRQPVVPRQTDPVTELEASTTAVDVADFADMDDQQSLQLYLERLQSQRLEISEDPKGIFVDSVFVPEGAVIDPRLELSLSEIQLGPDGAIMRLSSAQGPDISIPVKGK